ncbi:MAG: hypothetical protein V5A62_05390 [Haloarculaceae archaeon]
MASRSATIGLGFATLLVLLAGCGSPGQAPATPRGAVTPAPVPTDPPTPPPERAEVPAPLAGGTPDATALARAHAESLARRSYRLDTYVSRSVGDEPGEPGGSIQNRLDRRSYRVQSGGTYRASRVLLVVGSGPASRLPRWDAYADGEAEYRRVVGSEGTAYERRPLAPAALPPHRGRTVAMVIRYLDVRETTVERVVTERGPRVHVVGRDPRAAGLGNVSSYRVEALLTGTGRVERLEATYVTADGVSVRAGFGVRDVGSVRVDPPGWYDEARAETGGSGPVASVSGGTTTPTSGGSANATARPRYSTYRSETNTTSASTAPRTTASVTAP